MEVHWHEVSALTMHDWSACLTLMLFLRATKATENMCPRE